MCWIQFICRLPKSFVSMITKSLNVILMQQRSTGYSCVNELTSRFQTATIPQWVRFRGIHLISYIAVFCAVVISELRMLRFRSWKQTKWCNNTFMSERWSALCLTADGFIAWMQCFKKKNLKHGRFRVNYLTWSFLNSSVDLRLTSSASAVPENLFVQQVLEITVLLISGNAEILEKAFGFIVTNEWVTESAAVNHIVVVKQKQTYKQLSG